MNKVLNQSPHHDHHNASYSSNVSDSDSNAILNMKHGLCLKDVSLLVIDIQNFHQLCESLSESQIAKIHSDYIECVTSVVRNQKGAINHIFGDKVVCSFNAAHPVMNHSLAAVKAAFGCKSRMNRISLHYQASHNFPHLSINASVVSGDAIVGVTGKSHIKHFSIFGELFNELMHYSKLNKLYNTRILINEACYKNVRNDFLIRLVDCVCVVTETKCVDRCLFEVHSEKQLRTEEWYYSYRRSKQQDLLFSEYHQAWSAYMKDNKDDALEKLETYMSKHPTDVHGNRLRKRVMLNVKSNPLLDLSIRLHDAHLRRSNSSHDITDTLYHSQTPMSEKNYEKMDLESILDAEGMI